MKATRPGLVMATLAALVAVFLFSAWTGFGREYTTDRVSKGGTIL